jgi:hypothetical protein
MDSGGLGALQKEYLSYSEQMCIFYAGICLRALHSTPGQTEKAKKDKKGKRKNSLNHTVKNETI